MVALLSTPQVFPKRCEAAAELVRHATAADSDSESSFVTPSSHYIHAILPYIDQDNEHFEVITTLLTRRLNMDDSNYTSVQTAKAIYLIHNFLLQASSSKFAEHYVKHIRDINNLIFANPRGHGDSSQLLEVIKSEARAVVDLLANPKELDIRRKFFMTYKPALPASESKVEDIIREYTGPTEAKDPTGLLNAVRSRISNENDCDIIILMISRRLNALDGNYQCNHTLKALKILQHCLPASPKFIQHWIEDPDLLISLTKLKCTHEHCDNKIASRIRQLVTDILACLDYHQQLLILASSQARLNISDSDLIRQRSVTPPPKSESPRLSMEDLKLDQLNIKDLTSEVIRKSREPVACGYYSDVYREKLRNGQEIAVKQIRMAIAKDPTKTRKNLRRELGVWSELSLADHPYLNPLLGISFSHNNQPAFVSPWHKNGSISDALYKIEKDKRLQFFHKAVQAVALLHHHRKKIIHGDIKPGNILVQNNLDPALSDYGLSRIIDDSGGSTSGAGAGTMAYQAPELFEGAKKTEASDIWALACVCYYVFTGTDPYRNQQGKVSIINEIRKGPPARPTEVGRDGVEMNTRLWQLLVDCWSADPAKRPAVQAVLERLEKVPNYGMRHVSRVGDTKLQKKKTEPRHPGCSYHPTLVHE